MILEIEGYSALCRLSKFIINDVEADYDDFGEKYDEAPEEAEPYGCGNMIFSARAASEEVLDKYKITPAEYDEVCDKLIDLLSFGRCGWCV